MSFEHISTKKISSTSILHSLAPMLSLFGPKKAHVDSGSQSSKKLDIPKTRDLDIGEAIEFHKNRPEALRRAECHVFDVGQELNTCK